MEADGNTHSMPTEKRKLAEKDITGLKYFDQIAPLLKRLHNDACDRDTAGNRILHYDQYCMLMLLYFFNPGNCQRCQRRMALSTGILRFCDRKLRRPRRVEEREPSRS